MILNSRLRPSNVQWPFHLSKIVLQFKQEPKQSSNLQLEQQKKR